MHFLLRSLAVPALLASTLVVSPAKAEQPGRGLTGPFEVQFLEKMADHHYAALRMSELAAGTDPARDATIQPGEGTSPSYGYPATPAKATLDEIRSMARKENRVQREEILQAVKWLKAWYGVDYNPHVPAEMAPMIQKLEAATPGHDFDHHFLELMAHHHYGATTMALDALVGHDLRHDELHRYAEGILTTQAGEINDMRKLLEKHFGIVDYQPFGGMDGRHSGSCL